MATFTGIRWTLENAAREFGLDRKTLSGRVRRCGIQPGDDRKFSTQQVVTAIYGDLEFERIRKTREEADHIAMENEEARGRLVDVDDFVRQYAGIYTDLVRIVKASHLSDAEKLEFLGQLKTAHELNEATNQPGD